jgi:hypothetical protein
MENQTGRLLVFAFVLLAALASGFGAIIITSSTTSDVTAEAATVVSPNATGTNKNMTSNSVIISLTEVANTVNDIDFSSPLNNTYNLGKPFLVQYDNTTNLEAADDKSYDLKVTFAGFGTINGIKYMDDGVANMDIRNNGIVYQNGIVNMTTESEEKATMTFESIGQRNITTGILIDNGVLFFNTNSTGELAFLNNTVAVYKDMIDERRGNYTTIAWEWK